jgi:hypothetical protein
MSTTFEWRDAGAREESRGRARGRAAAAERATTRSEPIPLRRPTGKGREVQATSRAVALRLRQRMDRARLAALAIVGLSVLGLIYLTQISHVARHGYRLSDIQRQQDRVARENQLLEYQITAAHNLTRAEELAEKSYGMEPLVELAPVRSGGATLRAGAAGTPQARYITVQRPAASAPTPQPTPVRVGVLDRLLNRLIGIGEASAGR